jgi:thiol-disulfide isomerase/thioredoxin
MKPSLSRLLAAALLASTGLFSTPALALEAGQRAPELQAQGPQGPVRLAQFKGQVVFVDFWASWCGPCKLSFPWMNEMHTKYAAKGLRILAVNLDQRREDADRFLAQTPAQFSLAYDSSGQTPKAYEVKSMPSSTLLDREGRVLLQHSGFRDSDRRDLENRIRAALGEPAL